MQHLNTTRQKLTAQITGIPGYLQSTNYPALTGLRGLAIIIVLLYHLGINHFLRHVNGWLFGRTGVDIFFVLSGFLITTLLIKEKAGSGSISLKRFYARRALRIVPVAYLFLLVMVLVNFILHLNITPKSFLYGFLYLKNLPVNGINDHWTEHLWSVSIEAQFYLFVPLLMFININKATIIAGMAVIGILVFALLGYNHAGVFYSNAALYHFCRVMMDAFWEGPFAILIGCLFSVLAFKGVINVRKAANRGALSCILFIAAIIIRSKTFYFYTPYLSEFVFDVLIGFVIVMSLNADNLFARLLNTRFLAWMGALSYSIYIWQQIFVWIPYRVTGNTLFILSDVLRLTGMMGAACLSYYFFERRFLKMKSHFAEPGIRSK